LSQIHQSSRVHPSKLTTYPFAKKPNISFINDKTEKKLIFNLSFCFELLLFIMEKIIKQKLKKQEIAFKFVEQKVKKATKK
jgi:hypothetical protein